jgi:hypothetical protein
MESRSLDNHLIEMISKYRLHSDRVLMAAAQLLDVWNLELLDEMRPVDLLYVAEAFSALSTLEVRGDLWKEIRSAIVSSLSSPRSSRLKEESRAFLGNGLSSLVISGPSTSNDSEWLKDSVVFCTLHIHELTTKREPTDVQRAVSLWSAYHTRTHLMHQLRSHSQAI